MTDILNVEFDPDKAASNESKHGVTFDYGLQAFSDPRCVLLDASRPKDHETRLKLVGLIDGALFTIVYTMRGDVIRLISVRRSNRTEEKFYGDSALHV